jgi:signal transduction histidine kinase/ActR/RegA family two-component response regulator
LLLVTPTGRVLLRYAVAIGLIAAVAVGRAALLPVVGAGAFLLLLHATVLIAAWLGGRGPGLVAAAGAALASRDWAPEATVVLLAATGVIAALLIGGRADERRRHDAMLAALRQKALEAERAQARVVELNRELQHRLTERNALVVQEQALRLEAEREGRHSRLLAEVAGAVNQSLDLDRMLPAVAAAARDLGEADSVRIALRRPGSETLGFRFTLGTRFPGYERLRLEPVGVAGGVIASGRPYRIQEVTAEAGTRDPLWPSGEDVVAAVVVPIPVGARIDGLLCVERRTSRPFAARDEMRLEKLAEQFGIALRNAELLAGEQSARAEAEAASRAKDEFLAMLGHELRNPLGAISNATRVLHQIGDQATRLQDIISRQTHHLARLLDDLLDVSRMTMGKIVLHRQPVDLRDVVHDSLIALEQEGKTDQHEIRVSAEPAIVEGDPTRLEQVTRNLLDNAIKYTPAGGRVGVRVAHDGDEVVLRVSDTGAGIPPDVLPRVFELFVQAERSLDRSMGGLGLGLTLVKRLVELHGGSVSAWSAGPDQGSEFIVRLPRLLDQTPTPRPKALAAAGERSLRILVIEDNRDARDGLRLLLESWGHRVDEAADGRRGLELALLSRPDVALVDVGLPGLDGYEVAQAIRATPERGRPLLAAVTGYGQPEDERRAREAGFDAHLVKPIDPDELRRFLARASARIDSHP